MDGRKPSDAEESFQDHAVDSTVVFEHRTSLWVPENDEETPLLPPNIKHDAESQPSTTRAELWSYYLYYNGNNGVGPQSYSLAM